MKRYLRSTVAALLALAILLTSYIPVFAVGSQPTTYSKDSNSGERDVVCTTLDGTSADDYYTGSYTYDVLSQQSEKQLYSSLHKLMTDTHSYTSSYNDCHYEADKTDCENNDGRVSLIYTSYSATQDQWNGWNREHVWPQSLGGNNTSGGGADLHHIRPSDAVVNSTRGNKKYGNVNGGKEVYGKNPATGCLGGTYSTYFEPLDNVKGDVARIVLYVYVRWGSAWGADDVTKVFESVEVLLAWCELDPVDTWEMGRNEVVEEIQGNRNVFIDYPEYAWLLFGYDVPSNMVTPSGEASNGQAGSGNQGSGNQGSGNQGGNTDTPDNPNQGGNDPVQGTVYNKVTELNTGDKVVIGAPAYGIALSATKTGYYNVGVGYTESNFDSIKNTEIFEVTKNADGSYTFVSGNGQKLALAEEYSSLNADGVNDKWQIVAKNGADGIFYLKNVGRGIYLEWYAEKNNWSTYSTNDLSDLFELSFYLVEAGEGNQGSGNQGGNTDTPDNPNQGGNTDTPAACKHDKTTVKNAVEASCQGDGYTGDVYCTECNVLISKGTQIPASSAHKYGEWQPNSDGSYTCICTVCGISDQLTVYTLIASCDSKIDKIIILLSLGISDMDLLEALSQ